MATPHATPLRTAIYARVSTSNHGQDTAVQLRDLVPFIAARGWAVADQYIDSGISGSKERRPELDRLMRDAHARKFDAVIVWKFDRFARSVSHLLRALETFNALGIAFVSLSEQMDTTTPAGKLVFTVLGAVAELERSLIVERVKAWPAECQGKRKTTWTPPLDRGRRSDWPASRTGPLLAQSCEGDGLFGQDVSSSVAEIRFWRFSPHYGQKPQDSDGSNCLRKHG